MKTFSQFILEADTSDIIVKRRQIAKNKSREVVDSHKDRVAGHVEKSTVTHDQMKQHSDLMKSKRQSEMIKRIREKQKRRRRRK